MDRKKIIAIISVAGAVLVLIFVGTQLLKKTPNVSLEVAPDSASILLDNTKNISQGELHLSPGKHTIKAYFNGFTQVTKTITVTDDTEVSATFLLNPITKSAYTYLIDHPNEELHREALGGQQADKTAAAQDKKNPLVASLPFIDRLYRIDYGRSLKNPKDASAVAIYITYYDPSAKQDALDWIKFKGIDPATLEIVYTDGNVPRGD